MINSATTTMHDNTVFDSSNKGTLWLSKVPSATRRAGQLAAQAIDEFYQPPFRTSQEWQLHRLKHLVG